MQQEEVIWQAVIFGTALLLALGGVIISFIFLYQRKRYRHKQEVVSIQETFKREMLHSKAEIQEQTLKHIATEIHDNFTPTLSVINLNLGSIAPQTEDPVREKVTDTKVLVKQLMAEMRALSISLNSDQISKLGFSKLFQRHVEQLRKTGYYNIIFDEEGEEYRLSPDKEIIMLRMCQEVLNNIVKHAEAKNIHLKLLYDEHFYKITIADDGKGFDVDGIATDPLKLDSNGLKNLRSRALALNAGLVINSMAGQGTTITITIPL